MVKSVDALKRQIKQIKHQIIPHRTAFAWLEQNGVYMFEQQEFNSREAFEQYAREHGYTEFYAVTWMTPKKWMDPTLRYNMVKDGTRT